MLAISSLSLSPWHSAAQSAVGQVISAFTGRRLLPLSFIKGEIVLNQRIFEPVRGHQRVEYLSISTCV